MKGIGFERKSLTGNDFYRFTFENVRDPILILLTDGRIIDANVAVIEASGYSKDELLRMNVADLRPPSERPKVKEQLELSRQGRTFETEYMRKDGSTFPVEISTRSATFDGDMVLIGVIRNISERKRAEEALRLTQFSVDKAGDEIFWIGKDGSFFYVNDAACQALGYTRDELLKLKVCDIDPNVTEKNWPEIWGRTEARGTATFVTQHRARDGRVFPVEVIANNLQYNQVKYHCAFARDISERERAEEQLKEAKTKAELYLDLMGHDINNMHQIALGYLEIARDLHPEANQGEVLDKSIEALHRSAQLIRNVRKLQKLNEDIHQLHEVDVVDMLHAMHREFGSVPGKNVTLNINCEEHCDVRANELLHDVFANLVGNAIKHTGEKADINIVFDVIKGNEGRYCRISIEDDGPGIPDDSKEAVFNRILKGSHNERGTGLGLYIVKTLVDSYGGQVWVENRVSGDHSKGARFVVTLPAVDH